MGKWKRDNKAILIETVSRLMGAGWAVKAIAIEIGKSTQRVRMLRQLILESARYPCCKACGQPLKVQVVGTTVPDENVKPAD